jgi:hypothetical protein
MKKRTRTEITIEARRRIIVRRTRPTAAWCRCDGRPLPMVTAEDAAALTGVSARAIYRWVEAARLHFAETADGRLLVCLNSLRKHQEAQISAPED